MARRKTNKKYSARLHTSRQRTNYFCPPRAKKLILFIIPLIFISIIIAIICAFVFTPEHTTTSTISHLATDYYENYFHPSIVNTLTSDADALKKYETYGFAPVTLRQLLLYDNQKNAKYSAQLLEYCDENATRITFYPNPPYGKTDYHVEYNYSCNF